MNIWIFNHYAVGPGSSGGTRHYDLAKQLAKKGHSVKIFASSFNHLILKETVFHEKKGNYFQESINGVDFIWVRTPKYHNALQRIRNIFSYTIKSYSEAIRNLSFEKPDVIIGSSVHPLAALVGYLISRKAKCLFYFEERDLWPQTFVDFGKISKRNPLTIALYKLEKFFYKKADRIIVLFDKAKNYVVSKGVQENKVIYLPNGVDLSNYEDVKESKITDAIFSGLENKFVIIYLGSHGIANHLEPVIDLCEELKVLPNIHLLMVGNGLEKEKLMRIANERKLDNITFNDSVSKELVPSLLKRADLSIISMMDSPLYKWGFSMNKLYDYMAAGLPIIMIANPSTAGKLGEVDGVHASLDNTQLISSISLYSNNKTLLKIHSDNLKKYVDNYYSWEKLANILEKHFLEDRINK